jgi:hypothetical protein
MPMIEFEEGDLIISMDKVNKISARKQLDKIQAKTQRTSKMRWGNDDDGEGASMNSDASEYADDHILRANRATELQ